MKKLFLIVLFCLPVTTWASGLSKSVWIGPKAVGMGGAFVGIADDPTAIFHNPAGMTQIKGHQLYFGVDGLITDLTYEPQGQVGEKAKTEFLPVPSFAYVTDWVKPISLGLGVFFPHGNGGEFSSPSTFSLVPLGPTNPNEGRIYSLELAPAVAWAPIPELSLGATLRIVRISSSLKGQFFDFSQALGAPFGTPGTFDTLSDLDVSGWGFGASAGILYKPCKYASMGANYRSKVNADLSGNATFEGMGSLSGTLEQTLPTLVSGGFAFYPMDRVTIGLTYDWERNSEIESFKATLQMPGGPQTVTLAQNWEDSHTIHVGAQYMITPDLAGRVGYAKDLKDSIPDSAMNRIIGDIAAHEVSVGVAYQWSRYNLGLTWNARFGERNIPQGTNPGAGTYEAVVQAVSLGVGVSL